MRKVYACKNLFHQKLIEGSLSEYQSSCLLTNNSRSGKFDFLLAVGVIGEIEAEAGNGFEELKKFYESKKDWLFGYLSYDVKNEIENLSSNNFDGLNFPVLHFFQPEYVFIFKNEMLEVHYPYGYSENRVKDFLDRLCHAKYENLQQEIIQLSLNIKSRITKKAYLKSVSDIKNHIKKGDVYEMNFCQEFYAENAIIDPFQVYLKLNRVSPMPFSCFYRNKDKYLMCASPERFLKKEGSKIISQPIKGTIKRGATPKEDEVLKNELLNDPKERSENVMIVDIVRNDLSRTAKKGSVKVDELFGIYSFPQVHQMISTVSSELREDINFIDAIKYAFPMGSMTGAPKIKAMELIEKYETTKRGLYSGAAGYITPGGDFDLNVVIRSILYNETEKYLSFTVGSAITHHSIAESEYEECLLKAKAMFEVLT